MTEQPYNIPQQLSFREFFFSTLYTLPAMPQIRKFGRLLIILWIISLGIGLMTVPAQKILPTLLQVIVSVLSFLIVIITFLLLVCIYFYKVRPHLFHHVSYTFNHWGVTRHGERAEFSQPWRNVTRYRENRSFIFLHFTNGDCHVIQKRMLPGAEALNAFRQFLKQQLNH